MHNFTKIKYRWCLLLFLSAGSLNSYAQERTDTVQYSTDTTTIASRKPVTKGRKFKGKIVDEAGIRGIPGVNISVTGFSASISNDKGEFEIDVPLYQATLEVSMQGYHTKLVPVKGKNLVIRIYPETFSSLFASINVAGGSQPLARTIAAVGFQNGRQWTANNETPASNYQGRLSGVNTIRRSGTPGIGAEVFVRGFTSLYATNKPLYVVDGMIYDTEPYGPSITGGHSFNALQNINVNEISGITVVKDAVQSALYGSRAANGVVFISTNQLPDLDTKINFSGYSGFNLKPKIYPVMNAFDFRSYLPYLLSSSGLSAAQIDALPYMNDNRQSNPAYAENHNDTKWQEAVFRTSYNQNYHLSISGGDNIARYSLSLGYLNDKGVTDSTGYARYNSRFNAYLNFTPKLTGQVNLAFTYQQQNLRPQGLSPLTNPIFLSLVKSPFFNKNQLSALGEVSPKLSDVDSLGIGNPRAVIDNGTNTKKNYRFFGSINFDYKFTDAFKFSNLVGLTYDKTQEGAFIPRLGVADEVIDYTLVDSRLGTGTSRLFGVAIDSRLQYTKTFARIHKLDAMLGTRYNANDSEFDQVLGFNSGTDQLISIGNSNALNRIFNGRIGKWRTLNSYFTGTYSYADRYLINAAIAVDGSSRFGTETTQGISINGNRYGLFPAIGAAWIISSEKFMHKAAGIDLLKLRLSYGLTGNDDIGNYTARKTYVSQNLIGLQGLVRGNLANPALQWEVVKKANAGLDAAFFNERLSFSADLWHHQTDQMLTEQQVNEVTAGINSYVSNNAGMKSSGIDVGLNVRILNTRVKWDAGFNISTYRNRITKLGSAQIITDFAGGSYITQPGGAANLFYGYQTRGVYATQAEATAENLSIRSQNGSLVPFSAGDMKFADLNGDHVIDDADRTVIGNPNPKLFGGFNHSLSFKKWRLDALFNFVSGNDSYNYTRSQLESGAMFYNQTPALLNQWRMEGQVTAVPKATYGDPMGNSRFSDRWVEDASYLRLRTLALTYSLPFTNGAFKYLNVYATASNLFTFSNYKGFDPEFSAGESIFSQGVDTTLEPQFRSVQLGIRLGL